MDPGYALRLICEYALVTINIKLTNIAKVESTTESNDSKKEIIKDTSTRERCEVAIESMIFKAIGAGYDYNQLLTAMNIYMEAAKKI